MDDERFERAWSAYGPAVLRYCTFSTGSRQEGEDLAAETFARLLTRGTHVPSEHIEAWLITVARNLCATHHRSLRRRARAEYRLAQVSSERVGEWERPESWEHVRCLKESERLVVYLRLAEDRPFAEIAQLIGKSEGASKMAFYRAIDHLRRIMIGPGAATDEPIVGGAERVQP